MSGPGIHGEAETRPPEGAAPPPRRRRRWARWLLGLLLLVLALVAGALWWITDDARLTRLVREQLAASLGTNVSLTIRQDGLHRLELLDLELGRDSLTAPLVSAGRVGLYLRPGLLWQRRLHVDSLVLEDLVFTADWRDSLRLPAWLGLADSSAVEDTSSSDPFALVGKLADHGFALDSSRLVLRRLAVGLSGSQGGQPLELRSPPLSVDVRLPRLGPGALREISRRRLPGDLSSGVQVDWSGVWDDPAPGGPRRPLPLPAEVLAGLRGSGLGLERAPRLSQDFTLRMGLARDTLRVEGGLSVRPADLDVRLAQRQLPLPARTWTRWDLVWPVKAAPIHLRAGLQAGLEQDGLRTGLTAELGLAQRGRRWAVDVRCSQTLDSQLGRLAALCRAVDAPVARGDLAMALTVRAQLELDSSGHGAGSYEERLTLDSRRLALPEYALEVDGLRLEQSLRAGLDLSRPLPADARLRVSGTVGRLGLGLAPLEDPRGLDLLLTAESSGGDSLALAADLSIAQWQQGRLDLSLRGRLPSLDQWLAEAESWAAQPQRAQDLPLRIDLETSQLRLDGLDPSLAGSARLSATVKGGDGFQFWAELVPSGLVVQSGGERLALPLHRLEAEGRLRMGPLEGAVPWPDTLAVELRPDPLPALALQLGRRGENARLKAAWRDFDLPRLLALLPAAWRPADVELKSGKASLAADLLIGPDFLPAEGNLGVSTSGLRLAVPGYGMDGLDLALDLDLDRRGLDWVLGGQGESIRMLDPAWSWEGLSLAGSGRLEAPLEAFLADSLWDRPGRGGAWPADVDLELGLRSLNLGLAAHAELVDWRTQRPEIATLRLALGGAGQVRPWPGLRFSGTLGLEQALHALGDGAYRVEGRCTARLDSLAWQQSASLADLRLDLPYSQWLRVDPAFELPSDRRRVPVDWDGLRGWDRRQPVFGAGQADPGMARAGEGWALRIGRARYDAWSLEDLMVDLRPGQGRLDVPEFRFNLFGGGVRGSAELVGMDSTRYALDCSLIGLDSRYFEFGDRLGGRQGQGGLVHAVLGLEGQGLDLAALDQLRGHLRMPDLDREVTLNLLRALDAQGVDPSIGRIRRLLQLPGFRYRVERVEFDVAHGFARPRVSLKKSPFSPLPDVAIPMSPLPLGFMVRNFALATEETP